MQPIQLDLTQVITAFIVQIPFIITAIVTGIVAIKKINQQNEKLDENTKITKEINIATNGMKDELVRATAEASHAQGLAQGLAKVQEIVPIVQIPQPIAIKIIEGE